MSKHFCCCIPVRFGVFILSLLTLLGSASTAGLVWYVITGGANNQGVNIDLEGNVRIGFIVVGVVYTVFALISLLGFIGAIIRNRGLVKTYSLFLWIQLVIGLAMSVFIVVAMYNGDLRSKIISECTKASIEFRDSVKNAVDDATANLPNSGRTTTTTATDAELTQACEQILNGGRIGLIVSFVISFLINLYACIVVQRYGTQLTEEQSYKASAKQGAAAYQGSSDANTTYYPHTPLTHVEGGHYKAETNQYPYGSKEHAFGSGH